jgi:hypothetical protein
MELFSLCVRDDDDEVLRFICPYVFSVSISANLLLPFRCSLVLQHEFVLISAG